MKLNGYLLTGYVCLLFSSIIFGLNIVGGRYVGNQVPPVFLSAFRSFCGILVLLPFAYRQLKSETRPTKRDIAFFALLGFLGIALTNLSFLVAMHHSTVTKASIFMATQPAVTNLLLATVWRVQLSVRTWLGITLSFFGLLFVFNQGSLVTFQNLQWGWGDLWLVVNTFAAALFTILAQWQLTRFSPQTVTIYSLFFGFIIMAPYGIWQAVNTDLHLPPMIWLAVLYMGFMSSGLGVLMQAVGIKRLGSGRAAIVLNMMPLFGIIFGMILLKETLAYYHIISIMAVLTGVTLALYGRTKKKALPAKPKERIAKNYVG